MRCGGFDIQGPEWLWPTAFIMEAVHAFLPQKITLSSFLLNSDISEERVIDIINQFEYSLIRDEILYFQQDDWFSLPEMTNHDGEFNQYSCRSQAWSVGCLLWVLKQIACNSYFVCFCYEIGCGNIIGVYKLISYYSFIMKIVWSSLNYLIVFK